MSESSHGMKIRKVIASAFGFNYFFVLAFGDSSSGNGICLQS
jgi:hypothetical protein